jgi:hypothetical protein
MKDEHTTIVRLKQFVSPPPTGDACEQAGDSAESIGQMVAQVVSEVSVRMNRRDELPNADTLRRFRRLNRPLILCALEKLLRRVRHAFLRSHGPINPVETPRGVGAPKQLEHLLEHSGNTTVVIRHEAAQRLEQAAMLDSRSLDE